MLEVPGAVAVPDDDPVHGRDAVPGRPVAWHYGDPLGEQRRLVAGGGVVDLSHRPVVRITGADRLSWLHTVTSQHLTELAPGAWTQALVLSPHGHVEHHLTLVDDGSALLAHVEPGTLEPLLEYLRSMVFWSAVELADVTDDHAVVWRPGPTGWDGGGYAFVARTELPGVVGPSPSDAPAGLWAFEALRVEAGVPRLGFETDHRTIPHEVGWIGPAVHLEKGCYRGQETVARVQNLGRPPRRLVRLHLDGSTGRLPPPGTPLTLDGRAVGFVGTAVQHFELGPVALGLVKRKVPEDVELLAVPAEETGQAPVAASQDAVVPA